jgi:hypothetical protein
MTIKLARHGDQWAVILDESMLASLNVGPETPLEVTTDGRSLSIKPAQSAVEPTFEGALEAVNARHAGALRKLAE